MRATKITHKGESRIKIDFPYNQEIAQLIKKIPGAKWSRTMNAWHIPYTKKEFDLLKTLFPQIEYPQKVSDVKTVEPIVNFTNAECSNKAQPVKGVSVQVLGRNIILKLPKNALDTHFIVSLRYSRWDAKQYCWIVPNYPGNLDLINDYFKDRISELIIHDEYEIKTSADEQKTIKNNELLIIKTNSRRLKLIFGFNKELSYLLKKMPFHTWDAVNKWWTVPFSEKFLNEITVLAKAQKIEVRYEEEIKTNDKSPRITAYNVANYRHCPEEYILKLKELRYSESTLKSYKGLFEEFINYYHKYDINNIDEKMIIAFMRYLVIERKISTSYQNQSINSIKFYYERVLGGQRKIYLVERPRKEKTLPEVLSEQEIVSVIRQIDNIKHKAIVLLIYSAGLRLSEVVNLKIKDIDSERMKVFVQQAKGRKDRYTSLSKKVLPVLRQYFIEYKPKEWLFEGAKGRQYSVSSVQTTVKDAYAKAGIKKKVSTHTLRHSFATHLLENGTDLRYIQSLMGHESSKTTEIYTHITTKGFDQIQNPLDKLDF
ncbi:MAG: tyrosine-type recombinase/integrase [Bacteroidota bacterium]|nr:tyrosine-type recombinase/integrase [Bacteroidota bacterium]